MAHTRAEQGGTLGEGEEAGQMRTVVVERNWVTVFTYTAYLAHTHTHPDVPNKLFNKIMTCANKKLCTYK